MCRICYDPILSIGIAIRINCTIFVDSLVCQCNSINQKDNLFNIESTSSEPRRLKSTYVLSRSSGMPNNSDFLQFKSECCPSVLFNNANGGNYQLWTHNLYHFPILLAIEDNIILRHLVCHRKLQHKMSKLAPITNVPIIRLSLPTKGKIKVKHIICVVCHVPNIMRRHGDQYLERTKDIRVLSFMDIQLHCI